MAKAEEPSALQKARHPPKGQLVGYVRVSTFAQNENRQLAGTRTYRVFLDKASGKDVNRPQLEATLGFVGERDTVVCLLLIDRLGRNLDDLRKIILCLTARGVHVQSVKESLTFAGEDSPTAYLLLSVMGGAHSLHKQKRVRRLSEVHNKPAV